jgi:hypothetical protein
MNLTLSNTFNLIAREHGAEVTVENVTLFKDEPLQASLSVYIPFSVVKASLSLWEDAPIIAPTHLSPQEAIKNIFGRLNNPTINGDKFQATATINLKALKSKYPQLHNRLINGEPINGSVDMAVKRIKASGIYKNKPYDYIVTEIVQANNYAMLQDTLGACKVNEGCGFNTQAQQNKEGMKMSITQEDLQTSMQKFGEQLQATLTAQLNTALNANIAKPTTITADHVKPCEFNQLVERVTAAEAGGLELTENYTKLQETNKQLNENIKNLTAQLKQLQNNQNGVGLKADDKAKEADLDFSL